MEYLNSKDSYNEINDFLKNLPKKFSILQEEIDIEIQVAYFDHAKSIKKQKVYSDKEIAIKIAELNITESTHKQKKTILIELASVDNVKAFRAIENYVSKADNPELKAWSTLAMQESRIMMESSLLDENQVFISTGLGGKGNKLRYFIVGFLNEDLEFSDPQKDLLKKEFDYSLTKYESEIESIKFEGKYALITALIPLEQPIKEMLKSAIFECVDLGMNISEHFMVTNVKKMEIDEIEKFIEEQIENANFNEDDENLLNQFDAEEDFDND